MEFGEYGQDSEPSEKIQISCAIFKPMPVGQRRMSGRHFFYEGVLYCKIFQSESFAYLSIVIFFTFV